MDDDIELVWQRALRSIPTRADVPQFFVGTFTGVNVVYFDADGEERTIPLDEISCREVLNPNLPHTWFAIWEGIIYALSPLIPA